MDWILVYLMIPWGARRCLPLGLWLFATDHKDTTTTCVRGRYRDDDAYKASDLWR